MITKQEKHFYHLFIENLEMFGKKESTDGSILIKIRGDDDFHL